MSSAIYSAVSGLKAQQQKLDVISNNIANINTAGYKSQRVSFSDLLSQTIKGATAPSSSSNTGGINPMQVGLGVSVSSIDTDMSTGSTESTGNSMDVSIGGDGYFIVTGGSNSDYEFTRAGNFGVDKNGNLTVNGMKVCGWQSRTTNSDGTYSYNTQSSVEGINLFSDSYNGNKKIIAPKATTSATLSGNLDPTATAIGSGLSSIGSSTTSGTTTTTIAADTTDGSLKKTVTDSSTSSTSTSTVDPDSTSTMTVYDSEGNKYEAKVNYYKCYTDSTTSNTTWYWNVTSGSSSLSVSSPTSGYVEFDSNGKLVTGSSYSTTPSVTLQPASSVGSSSFSVKLDMSGLSTYTSSSDSSVTVDADGYAAGELSGVSIGSDGIITGSYSNGQKQPLAQIALATFTNPSGLSKVGDNLYTTTVNSGDFNGGVTAGSSGTGTLSSGTLEGSNVDLSSEFSDLAVTQRAYQANSKVITTSDSMMETLINMIR
ncbi:MAG TPA: flagellar hook protein FlgE [Syntrophomonadaceae bacterium]|nr:flagellar hook protein FlgE [Syntrophomonadaceae bacterium]